MIALDTNVLVRFIERDDEAQFAAARDLIAGCSEADKAFIGREALIELVWVLRRAKKRSRSQVVEALTLIAQADRFDLEDRQDVQSAILAYERGEADFADAMIVAAARRAGAEALYTFDQRAAALPGARLLDVTG